MPTYEYVCGSCAHEWEAEQSIKDAPLADCPKGHDGAARWQISRGTGFILKGGGWYSDLYASSSNKSPENKSEKTETKSETKPETKSDSGGSGDSGGSSSTPGSKPGGSTAAA